MTKEHLTPQEALKIALDLENSHLVPTYALARAAAFFATLAAQCAEIVKSRIENTGGV